MFTGIGCFDGMFSLQVKLDSKLYQATPWYIIHALQKPFKEEMERLQQQDIITPLGINEMVQWCNSFVLVPKHNGKVRVCLEPTRLNQAIIRPVHRGPTLNDIFAKLNNVKYLSLIHASSGYHNLNLDERSSYLTIFTCQFGRYSYTLKEDMFQHQIDRIFKNYLMYLALQMTY